MLLLMLYFFALRIEDFLSKFSFRNFQVGLSEFDQVLMEDFSTNRMVEALDLFEEVANSHWFAKTNMILFLNKRDLFMEKIKHTSIRECPAFEDYSGENTYEATTKYIVACFHKRNHTDNQVFMPASISLYLLCLAAVSALIRCLWLLFTSKKKSKNFV